MSDDLIETLRQRAGIEREGLSDTELLASCMLEFLSRRDALDDRIKDVVKELVRHDGRLHAVESKVTAKTRPD